MASFAAAAPAASIARFGVLHKRSVAAVSASPVIGVPSMGKNRGGVRCLMEAKPPQKDNKSTVGMDGSVVTTALVVTGAMASPAMALVDERMTTEGIGLPFGLSNNLLGWILLGVFALIWALYFVYTSGLEEDEESGLSL